MTRRLSLKAKLALAAVALAAVATAAYAYWTAGGSGSGSGATGTSSAVTVNQTSTLTALYPGGPAQTLAGTFDNPGPGLARVTTVTVSISGVVKATGAAAGTCSAPDLTLANTVMTVNQDVAAGTGKGSWSGATIAFNSTGVNQDACQGATVNLAYAVA